VILRQLGCVGSLLAGLIDGPVGRLIGRPVARLAQASPGRLGPAIGKRKITERRTRNR